MLQLQPRIRGALLFMKHSPQFHSNQLARVLGLCAALFFLGAPGAHAGLVGRYDFEDTNSPGIDSSGNGNDANCGSGNGSTNNLNTFSTDAAVGSYARQFFGNDAICFYPNGAACFSSLSNAFYGSFSWTAWVNTTNSVNADFANAYFGSPIWFDYSDSTNQAVFSITGSKAAFTVGNPNGGSDTTLHSTTSVNDGNYHFIAATRNAASGVMKVYVDGNLEATGISTNGSRIATSLFYLAGGYNGFYDGLVDDARVYDSELSASDVATLYGNPQVGFNPALNTSGLAWTTSGDTSWFVESTNTLDGSAAQSGSVINNQSSTLAVTVTGPGTLTFYWASQDDCGNFDYEFDMDGSYENDIYCSQSWVQDGPYTIAAGLHTLSWTTYSYGDTDPTQAGFLDQVSYVPAAPNTNFPPVITLNPFNQTNYPGYNVALLAAATSNVAVTWQWYKVGNTSPLPNATNALFIPTNSGTAGVAGNYFSIVTNANGSATSTVAVVTFQSAALPPDWNIAFKTQVNNNNSDATTNYILACLVDPTGTNIYTVGSTIGTNFFGANTLISQNGGSESAFFKQTTNGTAVWGVSMTNNGNGSSFGECMAAAPGGGIYAAGDFFGTNWLGTNKLVDVAGGSTYVARFDANGNALWIQTISGTNGNFTDYHDITSDPSGNVTLSALISGGTRIGTSNVVVTGQRGLLAQFDSNGNLRWLQLPSGWPSYLVYNNGCIYGAMGGATTNYIGGVTNVSDRHQVLFSINATTGQGNWVRGMAAQINNGNPYGFVDDGALVAVSGTNVFVAGIAWGSNAMFGSYTLNYPVSKGLYLARYDTNGNPQLATAFGSEYAWPWSIQANASGNVYIGSDFDTYSIFGNDIIAAPFYETVQSLGSFAPGAYIPGQTCVAKFDRNGNPLWARLAESQSSFLNSRDIALASDGVWSCGLFNQQGIFGAITINGAATCIGTPTCVLDYHPSGYLAKITDPAIANLPVSLINPMNTGANFQFQFLSQSGFTHAVKYTTNLATPSAGWLTYSNVTGDGTLKTIPIPFSVFNPSKQGFVRILTQ